MTQKDREYLLQRVEIERRRSLEASTPIATYHYVRIFESWTDAFTIIGEVARPSGRHFNDGYRYVDWLITVPLLLIELLLVMRLPVDETRSRGWRLGIAAIAMIVLGYPGESASSNMVRAFWGTASTVPFVYIMYQLFRGLGDAIDRQPDEVRERIRQARLLTLATWGFYPIVYMVPYVGERTAGIEAAVQIGYTLADVLAKAGFGLLIFSIARAKSRHEPADQVEYLASESGSR